MSQYSLVILPRAKRDLTRLPRAVLEQVDQAILSLGEDPRPPGTEPLQGKHKGLYKHRIRAYRLLYRVDDDRRIVTIVRVRHRREVYR